MTRLAQQQMSGGAAAANGMRTNRTGLRWPSLASVLGALPILGLLAAAAPAQAASATRVSDFVYDSVSGLLTKEIVEPLQTQFRLETEYVYDAFGNKLSATVSSPATGQAQIVSRTSSNAYDASGRFATSSTNALTQSETRSYDARFGVALSLIGPNSLPTTWQYDSFGRKILETRADGTMTKWEYLFCSGVNGGTATCPTLAKYLVKTTPLSSTDATPLDSSDIQNGPSSKVYYDVLGREIRSETQGFDGSGSSIAIFKDTEYDSKGRVLRASKPYYNGQSVKWTNFTYDAIGRVITETYPDNSTTTFTYAGLVTSATNALSQTKTTTKNSQGQVVQVKDTQNNTTSFAYDPFGNLVSTTDAAGNVTTATFDIRGRKTAMVDPDMGAWSYVYNVLGELVQQTDAKSQVSTMTYDKLGRITERAEPGLTSNWTYDTATKGVGKIATATASNNYSREHFYDGYGRPIKSARRIDQAVSDPSKYNSETSYDAHGRPEVLTYPSGFKIQYIYTNLGFLKEARKTNSVGDLLWQANTIDAEGHLLQQTYGNNVVTNQTFDANTSHLTSITAGLSATPTAVQNMSFVWDSISNLSSRTDATQNVLENFTYDTLNRLTGSSIVDAPSLSKTIQYNAIGNITFKSDVGTYTYSDSGASSVRPHAVTGVAGTINAIYTYDANGNMLTGVGVGVGRTITYTSFNMPATIARGAVTISFEYDSEHGRTKQVAPDGTTIYLGPSTGHHAEKLTGPTGTVRWTNYIHAGGGMVAAYYEQSGGGSSGPTYAGSDNHGGQTIMGTASTTDTVVYPRVRSYYTIVTNNSSDYYGTPTGGFYYEIHQTGGGIDSALFVERAQFTDQTINLATGLPVSASTTTYLRYFHKDHLGSISVITNEAGAVTERLSYDAWGKRRFPTGADDSGETITSSTDRGFTGHEHLEYVGLIHMNGRIYDPVLARFLTADPVIQDPTNTQSLNRYTYVLNNPLAYTDPSGYFSFGKFWKKIRSYVAIAVAVVLQQYELLPLIFAQIGVAVSSFANAVMIGTIAGGISGGTVKSALLGGVAAGLFYGVGDITLGAGHPTPEFGSFDHFANIAGHAAVGCAMAEAGGGQCKSGAIGAGIGAFAGPAIADMKNVYFETAASAVAGGIGSMLGGGKFQNGAMTSAFGYLFNHMGHMMVGTDAHRVLLEYLQLRDPGRWQGNIGLGGLFGGGRPDLIYDEMPRPVYEIKPAGSDAAARAQLQGYLQSPGAQAIAGDPAYVFQGAPSLTLESNWFFGRTTYTYTPGAFPGVVTYTVNRTSVFQEVYRAFQQRPTGMPMPLPMPMPIPIP